jgi:hypothetical protein
LRCKRGVGAGKADTNGPENGDNMRRREEVAIIDGDREAGLSPD